MINIEINQDKTAARLILSPDPEAVRSITADEIIAALKKNGVTTGISKKKLFAIRDHFNDNPQKPIAVIVARGTEKQATIQHLYKFHFNTGKSIGRRFNSDQIDYKNKGIIKFFNPGDVILEIVIGREGSSGRLVDGTLLPSDPLKPLLRYQAGPGVEIDESPSSIIYKAIDSGHPLIEGDKILISPDFYLEGDVDFESGHIEFAGPVEITGNLLAEFRIISNADVIVGKTVSGSIRTKGNLLVKEGIIGDENEKIAVGGDLNCEFISGVPRLQTGGAVIVTKHIINSRIITAKTLTCGENITGDCRINAFLGVTCGELGSDQGSRSTIEIGSNQDLKERIKKIDEVLAPLVQESIELVDKLGLQTLMSGDLGKISPDKLPEAEQNLKRYREIEEQVERLKGKKKELDEKISAGLRSRLIVKKRVFPGTNIKIGLETFTVDRETSGPIEFYLDPKRKTITFERP